MALFAITPVGDGYELQGNIETATNGWVAEITGPCPKYGLRRVFCSGRKSAALFFGLKEGAIYEYRNLRGASQTDYGYGKRGGYDGFFKIELGQIVRMDRSDVLQTFAKKVTTP